MNRAFGTISILMVILASGCGMIQASREAEAFANRYFENIRAGRSEEVLALYSAKFFEKMPKEKWSKVLVRIHEKLGALKSYELQTWHVNSMHFGTEDSGVYTQLVHASVYERYRATETIVVFKPSSGGAMSIVGHNINSEGLVLE